MFNTVTFNNKNLFNEFGVYVSGQGTFSAPSREYDFYDVPARDGDVLGIGTKLQNIQVSYKAGIKDNFSTNVEKLRSFLLSTIGYARLVDTYHPNEYRMALYEGSFDPRVQSDNQSGEFTLTFNCKPQRFLTSGETTITVSTTNTVITNPTYFAAKPLVRVYGYGQFNFGGVMVDVDNPGVNNFYIDCESMNIYSGSTNLSQYVGFSEFGSTVYGYDAPTLLSGNNTVQFSGNITKLEITPRWWEV